MYHFSCGGCNVATAADLEARLTDAVGISKATLYQHSDSKDAMLIALIRQQTVQFLDWLASTADEAPTVRLTAAMRYLMNNAIMPLRGLIQIGK